MGKDLYKIVSVTDKSGNIKKDSMSQMKEVCSSLVGQVLYLGTYKVGDRFCMLWNNDSDRMLRTSPMERELKNENDNIVVTTRNSIYYLEKV